MKHLKQIILCAGVLLAVVATINFVSRQKNSLQPVDLKQDTKPKVNFEPQTNSEGTVEITVSPQNIPDAPVWSFAVALNTHSVELNEDLASVSVLAGTGGNEYSPVAWEGSSPGGHHREGVLKFKSIAPRPQSITLKIRRVGGVDERRFSWQIQ